MRKAKQEFREVLDSFKEGKISFSNPVLDFLIDEALPLTVMNNAITGQGDLGFIDHLAEIEESFQELTNLALNITDATNTVTEKTREATDKIRRATSDNSQASVIRVKKISQSLAKDYKKYSNAIEESNPKYSKINSKIKASLDFVFNFIEQEGEGYDNEILENTKEELSNFENSLSYAKDELINYKETLESLLNKNLQKDLSQFIQSTIQNQERFVSNLDQTISTSGRTIRLIKKILISK